MSGWLWSAPPPSPPPPPPPPPPPTKTDIPWRKSHGWGSEVKDRLKSHCEETVPLHGEHFNVLLTGQIRSGKSSFYNSLCSKFKGWITPMVHAGGARKSLTSKFCKLEVKSSSDSRPLPLRIYDTMGLSVTDSNIDVKNILSAIDGHVPDQYEFRHDKEFNIRSKEYIADPQKEEQVHCVVFVIDASTARGMHPDIKEKIKQLKEGMVDRGIPVLVLLTKVDMICQHVNADVSLVYHSIAVRDAVDYIESLVEVPKNQVLPIVNYVQHDRLIDNMDVLLLTAVNKMVNTAQGFLELQQNR